MTNYDWLIKTGLLAEYISRWLENSDSHLNANERFAEDCAEWLQEEHKEPLKPCPFCGNDKPRILERCDVILYKILCDNCESSTGEYLTEGEAIYNWNRRVEK